MITYQFNADTNILDTVFSDVVTFHDIKQYMQEIHDKEDLPKKLNVIIDARNVKFNSIPTHSQDAASFNFSLSKKYHHIKTAFLSDDPNPTSMLLLYQHGAHSKNYEVKLFVLKKNALKWLS